ncbi:hypothetical protein V6N13_037683 [Hibiscus sabdariffa]|uniref:Peptidase metallopeptidase domain-containing protein n=1 Tax=Hibiscus sabdariffa TaxID=183260 RepID=A0ABR2S4D0_9ROSI
MAFQVFRAFCVFLVLQPFAVKSLKLEILENLERVQKGEIGNGVYQVKKYLKIYGYYPHDTKHAVLDDHFDDKLEDALKAYQQYYSLNVTGKVDSDTIKAMATPRCGVPDVIRKRTWKGTVGTFQLVSNYSFTGGKWFNYNLTYNIQNATRGFTVKELRPVIAQALQTWAAVSPFKFTEETQAKANINIGFFPKDHGDGFPFKDITLAHAFPPRDGRFHFYEKWNWSLSKPASDQIHVKSIAVHEFGHTIGLGHSNISKAIMFPTYNPGTIKTDLDQDDIDGLKDLYGY